MMTFAMIMLAMFILWSVSKPKLQITNLWTNVKNFTAGSISYRLKKIWQHFFGCINHNPNDTGHKQLINQKKIRSEKWKKNCPLKSLRFDLWKKVFKSQIQFGKKWSCKIEVSLKFCNPQLAYGLSCPQMAGQLIMIHEQDVHWPVMRILTMTRRNNDN